MCCLFFSCDCVRWCVLVCPEKRWGLNCENFCRCEDAACDRATGCTSCGDLYRGWTGPNCDQDEDECQNVIQSCGANSDCENTNGSYICTCHPWYQRLSGREERCFCKCNVLNVDSCNDYCFQFLNHDRWRHSLLLLSDFHFLHVCIDGKDIYG